MKKGYGQTQVKKKIDTGILCCLNCVGMHPDEPITAMDIVNRINKPDKYLVMQLKKFKDKKDLYAGKSCMLCGRTYDMNGESDETFELTARRVYLEFENAGISGVSDPDIRRVVATCRKSWQMLWANRDGITAQDAEKMTFCGRLALIITHAQDARNKRNTLNNGNPLNKGLIL